MNPYFLKRCIELARKGGSSVAPNPMVGAVITYNDRIIGEGYHAKLGHAHAEVHALNAVKEKDLLPLSTLYVSLEPCSHHGKTPPCADAVIAAGIRRVVVGCLDPDPRVAGSGIERLRHAGVQVELCADPTPFIELNRYFFVNQRLKRPYILLKWAETANGFIGRTQGLRLQITGAETNKYVHYLRSRFQAILIGKNTAMRDNPLLNVRNYYGNQPVRIVFDNECALPLNLNIFNPNSRIILLTKRVDKEKVASAMANRSYFVPTASDAFLNLEILMQELYQRQEIGSVIIEGGRYVLQQFINQDLYDEVIIFRSPIAADGDVSAPSLPNNFSYDAITTLGNDIMFSKTVRRF